MIEINPRLRYISKPRFFMLQLSYLNSKEEILGDAKIEQTNTNFVTPMAR